MTVGVPRIYFVGVTTGESAINRILPAWAELLGIEVELVGVDVPIGASAEQYRAVVRRIRQDPLVRGALVTTHKLGVAAAAADCFDELDEDACTLSEIGLILVRDGRFFGRGSDSITGALALRDIVDEHYWARTGGELVLLGAGGASRAFTLQLARRHRSGGDVPSRIVVTDEREERLEAVRGIHDSMQGGLSIDYVHTGSAEESGELVARASVGSLIVNATGLGKDRPGSPLPDGVRFPEQAIAWDFNYRGRLLFLDQARVAKVATVVDGLLYFIHGWLYAVAQMFDVEIPASGPVPERLAEIARDNTGGHHDD